MALNEIEILTEKERLLKKLESDGWKIETLATTTEERLARYKPFGMGAATAVEVIEQARAIVNARPEAKREPSEYGEGEEMWEPPVQEKPKYSVRLQRLIDEGTVKVDEEGRIV